MCAASPARYSRPYCIGSTTKLRMPVTPFSNTGPSVSGLPSQAGAALQLVPDPLVGPLGEVLVGPALHVEAADGSASAG